jgi:hypothetical protein
MAGAGVTAAGAGKQSNPYFLSLLSVIINVEDEDEYLAADLVD